jgi:hypothetical protein
MSEAIVDARAARDTRTRGARLSRGIAGAALATAIGLAGGAGCTTSGAPPEEIVAETSALRVTAHGLLRDALAAPIAGAVVEVRRAGAGGALTTREKTAADGSFALKIRAGTYDILVTPRDHFAAQSFPAQVIDGAVTLELILIAVSEQTQLSGRIVDRAGLPMPAQICGNRGCALAGDDGIFQLAVDADGTSSIGISGGDTSSFNLAMTLPAGGTDEALGDIVLPLFDLTGQVVDAMGAPVAGATVIAPSCYQVSADGFEGQDCLFGQQTDTAGRFHFVVLPGQLGFLVRGAAGAFLPIDVAGATDVTITVPPLQRLSGQVVDRDGHGQEGSSICLTHAGCASKYCGPICASTDSEGRYQLDVSVGDYALDLSPGSARPLGQYRLARAVSLSAAQGSQLDVVFPTEQLTGQVLDDTGAPDAGVDVIGMCYQADFDGWTGNVCPTTAISDGAGRFQLAAVAPGATTLQFQGAAPKSVAVIFGVDSDIQVQLSGTSPSSQVAAGGQIVDDDGHGVAAALVCYGNGADTCATSDGDGRYQLRLVPDTYQISASVRFGADDPSVSFPAVTVPSAPVTLHVVAPRRLPGQLLSVDGQPIAGATVYRVCSSLSRSDLSELFCSADSELTDGAGRFQLPYLPGAPASLLILLPGGEAADTIDIEDATAGGSATSVTLAVQPASAAPTVAPCPRAALVALVPPS